MQTINSASDLRDAILLLEVKQAEEEKMLREQFQLTYESIKPINLIKNTLKEVVHSGDLKDNILSTSVGLTAGYLSKVLFEIVTPSPLRKLLGTALMFGITNLVAKHPEAVKSVGKGFFRIIRNKLSDRGNRANNKETT